MERVGYLCATRWYNIEKARRVLGYAPIVGMDEGIRKTAEVCICFFFPCLSSLIWNLFSGGLPSSKKRHRDARFFSSRRSLLWYHIILGNFRSISIIHSVCCND